MASYLLNFVAIASGAALVLSCINSGRTSMPRSESHYERTVPHHLAASLAFARVGQALSDAYEDQPKALVSKDPREGSFLLEPIVTYKKGGGMGEVQKARYQLRVVVDDSSVALAFDLGPDVAGGGWAPKSEVPYIQRSFDEVVTEVAEAVVTP
jgi:hypothetical protein